MSASEEFPMLTRQTIVIRLLQDESILLCGARGHGDTRISIFTMNKFSNSYNERTCTPACMDLPIWANLSMFVHV